MLFFFFLSFEQLIVSMGNINKKGIQGKTLSNNLYTII